MTNTDSGTGSFTESDGILNDASPLDTSAAKNVVLPPVILEPVAKEKQSSCGGCKKALNFRTLFTPGGNRVDVVMLVDSIRAISERGDGLSVIATKLGTPLLLDSYTSDMCLQSWGMSSYARAIIELRADVELKDTIVVAMLKITGEGGISQEFKLGCGKKVEEAYGNKKKGVEPTKEVSNSNPFDVLNLVDNDGELGTNGGTLNLVSNGANSSGSSFWNVETNSTSTTPIVDKIRKLEKLIIDGKAILVDDACKPLKKIEYPDDHDSEDEVESVDNDMARSMASERVGFGTKSLLEQWRDSYENGDYDEDPYDDDMYEGQDIPDKIQNICDNLDIRARGHYDFDPYDDDMYEGQDIPEKIQAICDNLEINVRGRKKKYQRISMAPDMVCDLPNVPFTDDFEDLLENMELDEGLLMELLQGMDDDDDNMDQTSTTETMANDVLPVKEKNGDSFHFLSDYEAQLGFDEDKQIQDFDYWVSHEMAEMPCSFPGLPFDNEMMPFWHVENQAEYNMIDDIAYVELLVKEKVEHKKGLYKLTKWVDDHVLKRVVVTNAHRPNAKLMILTLGLTDFFHLVITGGECEHPKPAPDPYLKALEVLNVSKEHAFICQIRASSHVAPVDVVDPAALKIRLHKVAIPLVYEVHPPKVISFLSLSNERHITPIE
ncbi:UBN2 domain-containing protein [Tanacetum coccineum]